MHLEDEAAKVKTAVRYLKEDVILWWRRREMDIKAGICVIGTWEEFRNDFKK